MKLEAVVVPVRFWTRTRPGADLPRAGARSGDHRPVGRLALPDGAASGLDLPLGGGRPLLHRLAEPLDVRRRRFPAGPQDVADEQVVDDGADHAPDQRADDRDSPVAVDPGEATWPQPVSQARNRGPKSRAGLMWAPLTPPAT